MNMENIVNANNINRKNFGEFNSRYDYRVRYNLIEKEAIL